MKTKLLKDKRVLLAIFVCLAAALIAVMFAPSRLTAHAAFSGQSSAMSRADLQTATLETSVKHSDTATITILTHGLGGDAGDWSNGFNGTKGSGTAFAYDSVSLIEKIRNTTPNGIKLYRAVTSSASSFTLYSEYSSTEATTLTDFSQHTVIIFSTSTWIDMELAYERLHYAIDKISYDFHSVMGVLPRLNLIGHSMGGLLNMQYAIEHPKNVTSLVSLGTPYNGSWYDNWFAGLFVSTFDDQPCLTGACGHGYYFCNLTTRKNTWNNVYAQNTHINFRALCGDTSLGIMEHIIWTNNYLEDYIGLGAEIGIRAAFVLVWPLNLVGGLLPGDVCVDGSSQKASGYSGVVTYSKNFTTSNSNVNKRSQDNLPVPHNLEAYDADMHNYILNNVTFGAPFSTNQAGDTITGYNISLNGSINLPQTINGKTITAIGNGAFQNSQMSQITIPSSVESIGEYAFKYCYNLTNVYFESNSQLSSVGGGAFAYCYDLTNLILPNGLTIQTFDMDRFFIVDLDTSIYKREQYSDQHPLSAVLTNAYVTFEANGDFHAAFGVMYI